MNILSKDLLFAARCAERLYARKVEQDPWRLRFHLMPPVGWMNDPNGLSWYQGAYHVFFQYTPTNPEGGLKLWGHYRSKDLLDWEYLGPAIIPDCPRDCHGAYSGSAFVLEDTMHVFYTGNVKYQGNYDYIHNGRGSFVLHTESRGGVCFGEKECALDMEDYPEGYTCHIRDPKVWKDGNAYYMILGARREDDRGGVLIYSSGDLKNWRLLREMTTENAFGYMWECPDLFALGGNTYLSCSPQGVEKEEYRFQNVYQSGWFRVEGDWKGECQLRDFTEWDLGFDFYAPQTFQDASGRRILIGWMGIPDADYRNPETARGWRHALTVPREITEKDGRLYQYPVKELESLRAKETRLENEKEVSVPEGVFDLEIHAPDKDFCEIHIGGELKFIYKNGMMELSFQGDSGAGRTVRRGRLTELREIRVLCDTSAVEIYVNRGEAVFTTRYYPPAQNMALALRGCSGENILWNMRAIRLANKTQEGERDEII